MERSWRMNKANVAKPTGAGAMCSGTFVLRFVEGTYSAGEDTGGIKLGAIGLPGG